MCIKLDSPRLPEHGGMRLEPHYHWNMPAYFMGKEPWVTREKLTERQALLRHPDAWPVYRSVEMLPVADEARDGDHGLADGWAGALEHGTATAPDFTPWPGVALPPCPTWPRWASGGPFRRSA